MFCEEPILARVTTVARELARCSLDLVRVQEVRWNKVGTVRAKGYTLLYWAGNENRQLGTGSLQERRVLIKGEYLVRNTIIQNRWYILRLKLHVSAFIGLLQVSTTIEVDSIYAVKNVWGC